MWQLSCDILKKLPCTVFLDTWRAIISSFLLVPLVPHMLLARATPHQCPAVSTAASCAQSSAEGACSTTKAALYRASSLWNSKVLKPPFQQPFYLSHFRRLGESRATAMGHSPGSNLCVRHGGEEENQIGLCRNGKWKHSPVIADNYAVRVMLLQKIAGQMILVLIATHLSKETNAVDYYRLPVICETITTIVTAVSKKNLK